MSLSGLITEIAEALAPLTIEIAELNVYAGWSDAPTPPALDIYPASPFQTGAGFGPANSQVFLTVRARVAMSDPASGQALLLRLLDPGDVASVEAALDEINVPVAAAGVSGFTQYADDTAASERMLGCEWRVTTYLESE